VITVFAVFYIFLYLDALHSYSVFKLIQTDIYRNLFNPPNWGVSSDWLARSLTLSGKSDEISGVFLAYVFLPDKVIELYTFVIELYERKD